MCFFKANKPPCTCAFRELVQPCWRATFYPSLNDDNPNPIVQVCGVVGTAAGAGQRYCHSCESAAALAKAKAAAEATRPTSSLSTTTYTCHGQGGGQGTTTNTVAVDRNNTCNNVLCPERQQQLWQTPKVYLQPANNNTSQSQPSTIIIQRSVPEHLQKPSAPGGRSTSSQRAKPVMDAVLDIDLNIDDLLTTAVNFDNPEPDNDPGKFLLPHGDVPSLVPLDPFGGVVDGESLDPGPAWTTTATAEPWTNTMGTSTKQ